MTNISIMRGIVENGCRKITINLGKKNQKIWVDPISARAAIAIYNAVNEEQKSKIERLSLEKFICVFLPYAQTKIKS